MARTQRKTNKKSRGARTGGGDVPKAAVRTYHTLSTRLPAVTETCVVRGTQTAQIISAPTTAQNNTYFFSLNNANVGAGYWDRYRLEAVRFTIAPNNNAIGLVTNSTTTLVPLYCVIDYDDANSIVTAAAAQAYSNCVTLNPGESLERVFQPRMAVAAYTGAFTGYANMAPQWIDAASTTVQHYGIKTHVPGAAAAQTLLQTWNVTIEMFFTMSKSI